MPTSLPTTRPTSDAEVTGDDAASPSASDADGDAGVGQREQRHDDEARPRVEHVLEPTRTTDTDSRASVAVLAAVVDRRDGRLSRRDSSIELASADGRVGVSRPRTTPAIVACTPDSCTASHSADAERRRDERSHVDAEHARCTTSGDHDGASNQPGAIDVVGVEDRDHDDRADVVDDRQRQQEQLAATAARRPPSSASTPTANAMSVAIGMPHPSAPVAAGVEREVDQRRARPCRRARRRPAARRAARLAQLALDELALDLEADDEEEDRHQAVVDPVLQVERRARSSPRPMTARCARGRVGVLPRRVGPDQRDDRGGDAARRRRPPRCARNSRSGAMTRGPDPPCLTGTVSPAIS